MDVFDFIKEHGLDASKAFASELFEVIESIRIVERLGGIEGAKSALNVLSFEMHTEPKRLEKAISDYQKYEYRNDVDRRRQESAYRAQAVLMDIHNQRVRQGKA